MVIFHFYVKLPEGNMCFPIELGGHTSFSIRPQNWTVGEPKKKLPYPHCIPNHLAGKSMVTSIIFRQAQT